MLLLRTDAKTRLTARKERAQRVGVALSRRLPHARVDPAERVGECVAQTRDGGGTLSILGRGAVRPAARGDRHIELARRRAGGRAGGRGGGGRLAAAANSLRQKSADPQMAWPRYQSGISEMISSPS